MSKRCKACGQSFHACPQVPKQAYCSHPDCQRERRRRTQQKKRRDDPDYRDNDARYNKTWAARHPDYWKQYRNTHPDYVKRNQTLQQSRNQKLRGSQIAKVDVSETLSGLPAGRYRLTPITDQGLVNEDAWIVEITIIAGPGISSPP